MANVTYYIGAGASAGKRSKDGDIIEGLPCVNELTKRLGDYISRIQRAKFHEGEHDWRRLNSGLHSLADWENVKRLLVASLERLHTVCQQNATIDTYAKKLVLQGKKEELEQLERMLAYYFILEQIMCRPDKRYDTFLANILQDRRQFPDNIKVLSWNYDSQFEIAYEEYDSENKLSIGSKLSEVYEPFDILKLNGSATFPEGMPIPEYRRKMRNEIDKHPQPNQRGEITDPIEWLLPDLTLLYHMYVENVDSSRENKTNLSFAFDYNRPSDVLLHRADEIIARTEVMVIIGYTFPFFNREIDRKVLNRLNLETTIYIQDMNPERVLQSFLAVCPNVNDNNIHLLREVDQFFLPPQL